MTFRILSATVEHARYDRDFGQVEAMVSFLLKDDTRPVPHTVRIRTCEPAQDAEPLRMRLVSSARSILEMRQPAARVTLSRAA